MYRAALTDIWDKDYFRALIMKGHLLLAVSVFMEQFSTVTLILIEFTERGNEYEETLEESG